MLDRIEAVARESGARIRAAKGFTIESKGTLSNIVTTADSENEEFLRAELARLIPGSAFVGEEGEQDSILRDGYTWIVDPIDGTMNFSRGIPECAVSVALLKDGKPYIGVVYNPFTDILWKAERGKGAYRNGARIHVSERPFEDGLLCTAWSTYDKSLAPRCFEVIEDLYPKCNDIRRTGTAACELAMLAEGAVDLYFEIRLAPWDHAAADVCILEAGGCLCSIEGEAVYDRPCPVIAANSPENMGIIRDAVVTVFGPKAPYRQASNGLSFPRTNVHCTVLFNLDKCLIFSVILL
jgi:myo-inositol-1(or 4)-monophosphatase